MPKPAFSLAFLFLLLFSLSASAQHTLEWNTSATSTLEESPLAPVDTNAVLFFLPAFSWAQVRTDSTIVKAKLLPWFQDNSFSFGLSPSGLIVNKVRVFAEIYPLKTLSFRLAGNAYWGPLPGFKGEAMWRLNLHEKSGYYFIQPHLLVGRFIASFNANNPNVAVQQLDHSFTTIGYSLSGGTRIYLDPAKKGFIEFIVGLQTLPHHDKGAFIDWNGTRYLESFSETQNQSSGPGSIVFININIGLTEIW